MRCGCRGQDGRSGVVAESGGGPFQSAGRDRARHVAGLGETVAIDAGERPGTTTDDAKRIKDLEGKNRELKRANEILLAASSFFARELDPRLPW